MENIITPEMAKSLASPFDDNDVKWKPQVTTKGRDKKPIERNGQQVAGCTAHIDARAVMNRLDEVVGVGNWSDSYFVLPNGKNVECTLTVCGVSKSDVGEPNEGGFADLMKGAYSDALKRAAVKFGIGRYLYDMEMEWLPFDGYKILSQPKSTTAPKTQKSSKSNGTPPPAKQNSANGNGHKQQATLADVRASFDELSAFTLGTVADRAVMAGLFESNHLALNAMHDFGFPDGVTIKFAQKVTKEGALSVFDWLAENKQPVTA